MISRKIDLRGLSCPEPVLRAKKLFDDKTIERIEALVDDDVCVSNLKRLSRSLKASATALEKDGYFEVVMERGGEQASKAEQQVSEEAEEGAALRRPQRQDEGSSPEVGTVIFLAKDTFGEGDPEFSRTLLNLFLQSVLESGHEPRAILMANTGVKLMAADSSAVQVLDDFRARGCEVLACGLCVEFYGLKDVVPKDQVTNMFAIVEYLFAADKVLSP